MENNYYTQIRLNISNIKLYTQWCLNQDEKHHLYATDFESERTATFIPNYAQTQTENKRFTQLSLNPSRKQHLYATKLKPK